MIIFFSGTGNSRCCAELLADRLGDGLTDSFRFIRDGIAAELSSETPWVFVCPTYAWRIPRVFEEFIKSARFSGARDAYFVMTCGGEIGDAGRRNLALCREKGLACKGSAQIVMPENYIAMFDAPETAEALRIARAAVPALENAAVRIGGGLALPEVKPGALGRLKSGLVNAAFYRFIIRDKPFAASEACTGCGACAESCVMGNIELREGRPVWGGRCTHCMACICGCPASAIEYGKASAGKPRYRCPEYKNGWGVK